MDEMTIDRPVDMHAHLRQGDMLKNVVRLTTPTWAGALAMPNTDPPIDSLPQASQYYEEIRKAARSTTFEPYPTLYFRTDYTREFLERAAPHKLAIKFYPRGLTTNSQHGCDPDDPGVEPVLALMEELGIRLLVHPEAPGYYHDRERLFQPHAARWAEEFPGLKITLEHLSDASSLALLADYPNLSATVTPQHLLTTGDDWFGPPFDPHLYCMPSVKRPYDRDSLLEAATDIFKDRFVAGTDSAPHAEVRKLECGCAGVFSAPVALQLYAQAFDRAGRLGNLQSFVSDNARRIYGIDPPAKTVRLVRKPFTIPERYGDLVPMWAGKTIDWSIEPA